MIGPKMTFYAKTSILDAYMHVSIDTIQPDVLDVIVTAIKSQEELEEYFFKNRPHFSWASRLWDLGYFQTSPRIHADDDMLPRWYAQEYLLSIADSVPDVVTRHAEAISGHAWYLGQAIHALCLAKIDPPYSTVVKVKSWIKEFPTFHVIYYSMNFIKELAERGNILCFALFDTLTAPFLMADAVGQSYNLKIADFYGMVSRLCEVDAQQVASMLQNNLINAFKIDEYAAFHLAMRPRVDDDDPDGYSQYAYPDVMLKALRIAFSNWITSSPDASQAGIERLLSSNYEVFVRLATLLVSESPLLFKKQISSILLSEANLDNATLRYEYFNLLRIGFYHLGSDEQRILLANILSGPSELRAAEVADWSGKIEEPERSIFIQAYRDQWVLDRMWMIKDYLADENHDRLVGLVANLGEPVQPEGGKRTVESYWVADVSPISIEQLSAMSPQELVEYLKNWAPPPRQYGPKEVSYRGFAEAIAEYAVSNSAYRSFIGAIAVQHPSYAYAILDKLSKAESVGVDEWAERLELCEYLTRKIEAFSSAERQDWRGAIMMSLKLLESGMHTHTNINGIPSSLLPKALSVILTAIDDGDPDPTADQPAEGYFGYRDPATVSLNHVRPIALATLISYALYKRSVDYPDDFQTGPGPSRLDDSVKSILSRMVDRGSEFSTAVHSVFGRTLDTLYWLDADWVRIHLDEIFPETTDEYSRWHFVAAWDSYVIFNRMLRENLFGLLEPKYRHAIKCYSEGYISQTHLRPSEGFASHLIADYLFRTHYQEGSDVGESLIAQFLQGGTPEMCGTAIWTLWRACDENKPLDVELWSHIENLWRWRSEQASQTNYSSDFQREMEWFAHILLFAPVSRSISVLWPLLERLVPYLGSSEFRDSIWDELEKFLVREVQSDPKTVIRMYQIMHNAVKRHVIYSDENARVILQTAASNDKSRDDALWLIDSIATYDNRFRDIYEQYAR